MAAAALPRLAGAFALVTLVWGSMCLLTKKALVGMDPYQLTGVRNSLVGLIQLFGIALVMLALRIVFGRRRQALDRHARMGR